MYFNCLFNAWQISSPDPRLTLSVWGLRVRALQDAESGPFDTCLLVERST